MTKFETRFLEAEDTRASAPDGGLAVEMQGEARRAIRRDMGFVMDWELTDSPHGEAEAEELSSEGA